MSDAPFDDVAPPIAPHPRIRQRRVEVKRDEGRRRLRILVSAAGAIGLGALSYGVTRSPLFDVDTVRVRGATHTVPEQVIAAAGLDHDKAMTDVDEARIAARIEALPWVERATVARSWPGTVEVTLLERTPVAAVSVGTDAWALVDTTGRVLSQEPGVPAELTRVEVSGVTVAPGADVPADLRAAVRVVEALPEALVGRVPVVVINPDATLELRLDGKVPVQFGAATAVRQKLTALTTLVQKADLGRVRVIDVRVPTAPVLTRG